MKKILPPLLILATLLAVIFFSCKKEKSCEGCRDENKPPISIAGPDQVITLPTDSILLDGRNSSDPDGTISDPIAIGWLWKKIEGPASFTIVAPNDSLTLVKNLVAGTYRFELSVKDDGGLSAKDTVEITVNYKKQPNRPPVANAGADQAITLPSNTINLNGSGSTDPDNNISSYTWTKISGPSSFNIANANAIKSQVNNLIHGTYQFELKVTDSRGLSSKDTVKIVVTDITSANLDPSWEVVVTLPIDSVFIDDYYRDTEGTCLVFISGPGSYNIDGSWIKNLVPGVYFFRRYWYGCIRPADIIKVTVINDPNERNTITYKNLQWEYNQAWNTDASIDHLFFSRPAWPGFINRPIEVNLQMDFVNNGEWFRVPSNKDGYEFRLDCRNWNNLCLTFFIIKVSPEDRSWDGKKGNLKIRIL